jgi:hypothetical protein
MLVYRCDLCNEIRDCAHTGLASRAKPTAFSGNATNNLWQRRSGELIKISGYQTTSQAVVSAALFDEIPVGISLA